MVNAVNVYMSYCKGVQILNRYHICMCSTTFGNKDDLEKL